MGKAGRIACIFTPMALTIASLICTIIVEMGGWDSSSTTLNNMYFLQVNMSDLDVAGASDAAKTTDLDTILANAKSSLNSTYQIHLWNYCTSTMSKPDEISWCSPRKSEFVFDPVKIWNLNSDATATAASAAASSVAASNPSLAGEAAAAASSAAAEAKSQAEDLENNILGDSTKKALDVYRSVAKWQFIAYEVSFWTTLATIVLGILAIFSRWGSLLTWILSIVSLDLHWLKFLKSGFADHNNAGFNDLYLCSQPHIKHPLRHSHRRAQGRLRHIQHQSQDRRPRPSCRLARNSVLYRCYTLLAL